jgi:hypothetical protein
MSAGGSNHSEGKSRGHVPATDQLCGWESDVFNEIKGLVTLPWLNRYMRTPDTLLKDKSTIVPPSFSSRPSAGEKMQCRMQPAEMDALDLTGICVVKVSPQSDI